MVRFALEARAPQRVPRNAKISEEMVRAIRAWYANDPNRARLYAKYPELRPGTLNEIVARRTWRNVR